MKDSSPDTWITGLDDWTTGLIVICLILVFLPCKYDPLIRWKEFNLRWAKRIKEKRDRQ